MPADAGKCFQPTAAFSSHNFRNTSVQREHRLGSPAIGADSVQIRIHPFEEVRVVKQFFGNCLVIHSGLPRIEALSPDIIRLYM